MPKGIAGYFYYPGLNNITHRVGIFTEENVTFLLTEHWLIHSSFQQVDSGGPMMCKNQDGTWDLVGTTSWGVSNCGDPNYADVMARTSTVHNWIKKTIDSNGGPGDIITK